MTFYPTIGCAYQINISLSILLRPKCHDGIRTWVPHDRCTDNPWALILWANEHLQQLNFFHGAGNSHRPLKSVIIVRCSHLPCDRFSCEKIKSSAIKSGRRRKKRHRLGKMSASIGPEKILLNHGWINQCLKLRLEAVVKTTTEATSRWLILGQWVRDHGRLVILEIKGGPGLRSAR